MKNFLLVFFILVQTTAYGQTPLKPGFEPEEYLQALSIFTGNSHDPKIRGDIPYPSDFKLAYESEVVGLENKWFLWTHRTAKLAIINFRGTVPNPVSWLANFYSGMVPAKGNLVISETQNFEYNFSAHPKATVHVGWTLSLGALSPSLLEEMDQLVKEGYQDFIITGHSQGGAIAYLATAYLRKLIDEGRWDSSIRLKTYASAAPKPGNLFFAYEYESMTANGWAYNVVNSEDWVPQSPFSIQNTDDFSELNPFSDISGFLEDQKFMKRIVFKKVYNQLDNPTQKSQKRFEKYLGDKVGKQVQKQLPGHVIPDFSSSNHYVRTGNQIVLQADESYFKKYPTDPEQIFLHHMLIPYYELFQLEYLNQEE